MKEVKQKERIMITISNLVAVLLVALAVTTTPSSWLLYTLAGIVIAGMLARIARELSEMTDADLKERR